MNTDLEHVLCTQFPLLFTCRIEDHAHCYFEISCDDGWYSLVYDLCSKLEPLVEKLKNDKMCQCGELPIAHENMIGRGTMIYKLPYYVQTTKYTLPRKVYESNKILDKIKVFYVQSMWKLTNITNKFLKVLYRRFNIGEKVSSTCKEFKPACIYVMQIKEKFGTLRFYLSEETDEMSKLIEEAEAKSAETCEVCGAPGTPGTLGKNGYWITTLCETHKKGKDSSWKTCYIKNHLKVKL